MDAGSTTTRWLNVIGYVFTVLVNSLAGSTKLIGSTNTATISEKYPTLITPPGYVFSIWGVIYVLLGLFVVVQALPSEKGKEYQKRIGNLFVLSSIFNILWLLLWQYELLILSVVVMFLLLATLVMTHLNLGTGKTQASLRERLAIHAPFSVYLGWITIATIANVSVTLVSLNWNGLGIAPETWSVLVIGLALTITLLMVGKRNDVAYGLVVIWALVGITLKQNEPQTVAAIAETGAVVTAIAEAATLLRSRGITRANRLT